MQLIECRGCTLGLTLSIFPAATNWNRGRKKERQVRASEGFEGHRDKEGKREKAAGGGGLKKKITKSLRFLILPRT